MNEELRQLRIENKLLREEKKQALQDSEQYRLQMAGISTSPAQRQWVGLTDGEVDEIYTSVQLEVNDHWDKGGTTIMFPLTLYKAIEAKLKEKNSV